MISCKDEETNHIDNDSIVDTVEKQNVIYVQYSIPLPINLFEIIEKKSYFRPEIMSSLSIKDKYLTQVQNAVNLGVYSADLAYCTIFENGQNTIEYSDAASYFANNLSIEDAYGEPYIKRLEQNINNKDSLVIISNEAYNTACNYLNQKGIYNVLPFVIYGAWIESMYLMCNSDNSSVEELKNIIIKKESSIDNMITYMYDVQVETSAYYYNKELKSIIYDLKSLEDIFENYSENKTDDSYIIIVERINKLRNELVI